jgi:hypothetical protein
MGCFPAKRVNAHMFSHRHEDQVAIIYSHKSKGEHVHHLPHLFAAKSYSRRQSIFADFRF